MILDPWYVARQPGFRVRRGLAAPALLILVAICAAPATAVVAQDRLERLEISLWPEYDRPAMLVMLRAWLPADAEFPAKVALPMPAVAGTPSAVAFRAPDGSMRVAPNTMAIEGDTIAVTFTTPEPEIRLEYYVALDIDRPERAYRFHWPGGLAVGQITYDVLHPWGAADVEVVPAGTRNRLPDGLVEERGNLGALTAADEFDIDVRYTKLPEQAAPGGAQDRPAAASTKELPPASRFNSSDESGSDARWLVLFVVATFTFLGGFALGRLSKRS